MNLEALALGMYLDHETRQNGNPIASARALWNESAKVRRSWIGTARRVSKFAGKAADASVMPAVIADALFDVQSACDMDEGESQYDATRMMAALITLRLTNPGASPSDAWAVIEADQGDE
jgi:hypothetical protein